MVHRKSIIKAAIDRLEGLMAIGESRREAKQAVRASGERIWAFSTGRIHSFKTRSVYQEHILRFINWCRDNYQIKHLEELDAQADELACQYLNGQIYASKSPYTLQVRAICPSPLLWQSFPGTVSRITSSCQSSDYAFTWSSQARSDTSSQQTGSRC